METNITLNIDISQPGMLDALLRGLRELSGGHVPVTVSAAAPITPAMPVYPSNEQPTYPSTTLPAAPIYSAPTQPAPAYTAPAAPPAMPTVPVSSPPAYTLDQLTLAAAPLMDSGRMNDLMGLLSQFGVISMQVLPKERYGDFATALRGLGAKI